jgi:hypothetical protein
MKLREPGRNASPAASEGDGEIEIVRVAGIEDAAPAT